MKRIFTALLLIAALAACTAQPAPIETAPPSGKPSAKPSVLYGASAVPPATAYEYPAYEIKRTLYTEYRTDDGVLLAIEECYMPVFAGDGDIAAKMNEYFDVQLAYAQVNGSFSYLFDDNGRVVDDGVYEQAKSGRTGEYSVTWTQQNFTGKYLSFSAEVYWDGFGAHPGWDMQGVTFDVTTGEPLLFGNMFDFGGDVRGIGEILSDEYVAYQREQGDDVLVRLAQDLDDNGNPTGITRYRESVAQQLTDSTAIFWLQSDGIHVFFDQYTFFYAVGASEMVIPFTRTDILSAQFLRELGIIDS